MTNNPVDRLDRMQELIENFIAASVADRAASNERLTRVEQIISSNAQSIQALTDNLVTFKLATEQSFEQAREERQELRIAMLGIANLLSSLDSDRPTILRKLNSVENKLDRLLERGSNED